MWNFSLRNIPQVNIWTRKSLYLVQPAQITLWSIPCDLTPFTFLPEEPLRPPWALPSKPSGKRWANCSQEIVSVETTKPWEVTSPEERAKTLRCKQACQLVETEGTDSVAQKEAERRVGPKPAVFWWPEGWRVGEATAGGAGEGGKRGGRAGGRAGLLWGFKARSNSVKHIVKWSLQLFSSRWTLAEWERNQDTN